MLNLTGRQLLFTRIDQLILKRKQQVHTENKPPNVSRELVLKREEEKVKENRSIEMKVKYIQAFCHELNKKYAIL